jgi:8-oxo-dGTP pyrophosphatase MutT (NUDIX family)
MTAQPIVRRVAAAVLRRPDGRVVLLKRADSHQTNPGQWCFVTGYIEDGESPRNAAIRELEEELGLIAAPILEGAVVNVALSPGRQLNVYPFLFETVSIEVVLDREHSAYVWIMPTEVGDYDTVPQLADDLKSLGLL